MIQRDPRDSTLRSDGGHLLSREAHEQGIMWLTPQSRFLPFQNKTVSLGRDDTCDFPLPGAEASRFHAELSVQGALMELKDLGSTNGTHHNGVRTALAYLKSQDVVRLGEWVGVVCRVPRGGQARVEQFGGVYAGTALREVMRDAEHMAASDVPLILVGESGTGKEVLAKFIHERSGRRGEFVAVNCAALPEQLVESELFGHTKGAFTGAAQARPGHFRAADGGTLLLDEIADLPMPMQAKLLRVLEESVVVPLGSSSGIGVDVRVIAASQQSLARLVTAGTFRGDLFARLNGLELQLPPLRLRREEAPFIFYDVLTAAAGGRPYTLHHRLVERLCLYDWPYNVRELVQLARRVAALYPTATDLGQDCLPTNMISSTHGDKKPPSTTAPRPGNTAPANPSLQTLGELNQTHREEELAAIRQALKAHGGSVSDAAKALGISRQKIYRLVGGDPSFDLQAYRKNS